MAQNEKIRTEDVVEVLDSKILTSEGHPSIGVNPRESYSNVLVKIAAQVLSPEQKEAFDATLTSPSSLNPVVLKNDLSTYIPQADLGEVKDSVSTYSQLPMPFTALGSVESGSTDVTITSSPSTIKRYDLVYSSSGFYFDDDTIVVEVVSASKIRVFPVALQSASDIPIVFSPVEGDLRGVIADGIIYRWDGTAWLPFTRTGTMQHPELLNQNSDANYQHLTTTEKNNLIATSHSHANKAVLDAILSIGSGHIITTVERSLLPTAQQKAALVGTSGIPGTTNPYVTHLDPRLNTTRNPYVTIGLPGSLATFQGVDFRPFEDAILAIDIGAASTVKAIEVLSGIYNLSGVSIIWNMQPSSLRLESFTPQAAILSFQTRTAGIKILATGGPAIVRGFTFELNDQDTAGILSTRENTLIEDCVFKPGATTSTGQIGITLEGAGSIVRRCRFLGELTKGIEVKAANCRIEGCTFELSSATNSAIDVLASGSSLMVDHCVFMSGLINIHSDVLYTTITNNRFYSIANSIIDNGNATRYLENQPAEVNQPFIGKKRTVGHTGTYADYRGHTQDVFLAALADPFITEIEVLDGDYLFSTTVEVPEGKSLRGVWQRDETRINFISTSGQPCLRLSNWSNIENLQFKGDTSILVDSVANIKHARIINCEFSLLSENNVDHYELVLDNASDCLVNYSSFKGKRGLLLKNNSLRTKVLSNVFSNDLVSLTMAGSHSVAHIKCNHFLTAPAIAGDKLLVENNHFIGGLPTKLATSSSIWQGNWPHPSANNDAGVDVLDMRLNTYLDICAEGVERSLLLGVGTFSFYPDLVGGVATLPVSLPARLDKTKTYTVNAFWTCASGNFGSVVWRATITFRSDTSRLIGTSVSNAIVSQRLEATADLEESISLVFTNYGLAIDPTHVSVFIERVGSDVNDTLLVNAHLLEVQIILNRD